MAASPELKVFEKYIASRKILIVDPSSSSRSGLFKIFHDLGVKTNQIILCNTYKQAEEIIVQSKPHIVIAEYELEKKCGLDLLQNQRLQRPKETKETLFIVVTGNTSQTAVAKAAEEDIDAYVIKPFTPEVVRNIILKAAMIKINPPDYLKQIEKGKNLLEEAKLDEAEACFNAAIKLDKSPALAYYYLGQVKFLRQILEQAKGSYTKGLELNKIHYKCLVGLYEILMSEKSTAEAYEVVKRISQYFPANPKRLAEVLKLAIMNAKYEDVEKYYSIFCNIDERDEVLIKYICAALVVCGRHYLNIKQKNRAIELFQKAAATGTGRVKILKEIVQALVDFELPKESKTFLAKFPPESQTSDEYLLLKFKITNLEGQPSITLKEGLDLLKKGIGDKSFFEIMLKQAVQTKQQITIENVYNEGIKKFPNSKPLFDEMTKGVL